MAAPDRPTRPSSPLQARTGRWVLVSAGVVVLASLAVPSFAQAGLGTPNGFSIDVETTITRALGGGPWNKCIGCARDASGSYWVSVGNPAWTDQNRVPGKLVQLDAQGNFVAAFDQPSRARSSFGLRDLTFDGVATLYGGLENFYSGNTLLAFDVRTRAFAPGQDWSTPYVRGAGTNVVRGLAYDPQGDNGRGSMWTADYGPELTEFSRDGRVMRQLSLQPNPLPYGLAVDATHRALWLFCVDGSTRRDCQVVGIEIDLVSGQPTGTMFLGDTLLPPGGGAAGGCELFVKAGKPTLLLLAQADRDTIYEVGGRFRYGSRCGGSIAMANDAPWRGNRQWAIRLEGSSAVASVLMLGVDESALPLPPPLFATGCSLLLTVPVPVLLPAAPVVGGRALQRLPIPLTLPPLTLFFQWLEAGSPITTPLRLSDAGKCLVGS